MKIVYYICCVEGKKNKNVSTEDNLKYKCNNYN